MSSKNGPVILLLFGYTWGGEETLLGERSKESKGERNQWKESRCVTCCKRERSPSSSWITGPMGLCWKATLRNFQLEDTYILALELLRRYFDIPVSEPLLSSC